MSVTPESLPMTVEPDLDAKRRFLRSSAAHPGLTEPVHDLETHMSWLFFVGDRVLKLKKPVRFEFLDFSTLADREFYCREEVRLNSRLAPDVYLGLLALQFDAGRFSLVPEAQLPAPGRTVDWLVSMRRLPPERTLLHRIARSRVEPRDIDALVDRLVAFYRAAPSVPIAPDAYLGRFHGQQATNRQVLLMPHLQLPDVARVLDRFDAALTRGAPALRQRALNHCIVEGHGDLRPEHVWLVPTPVVIDCLEFSAPLRQVDPYDELAFLAMECALAGADWIGQRILAGCAGGLGRAPSPALMAIYTAHRALLRARLAMAHLLDSQPRTPQRWPLQAERYLGRAVDALDALDELDDLGVLSQEDRPGTP